MTFFLPDLPLTDVLLCLFSGYLLGSLPFGLILTRLAGLGDLRDIGSGNIGATNVLRTGNRPLALATLLLDSGKGALAVLAVYFLYGHTDLMYFAGAGAFLGHLYPIFLKFKGGKGVATFMGTLLAINWALGLGCIFAWSVVFLFRRISSLSALFAAGIAPVFSIFIFEDSNLAIFTGILCIMIFIRHADNIKRLLSGTEPKVGEKSR